MAGHYFYDPRPFYGHSGHTELMPLDELFYGRYDPVIPYWMDQRMFSFDDSFYPRGLKQRRGPEVMQQQYLPQPGENNFMAYKRPELVRDDLYTDLHRHSPYNFHYSNNNNYGRDGFAVAPTMHPEIMRQQQPLQGHSQDDIWVPAPHGHGQRYRGLPEPPPGAMATRHGTDRYYPNNQGGNQPRQVEVNGNDRSNSHNNSQGTRPGNNHSNSQGNNHNSSHGNTRSNSHGNDHGNSHGNIQMRDSGTQSGKSAGKSSSLQTSKQTTINNTKRYDASSSSDSEDDDDLQPGRNNGGNNRGPVKSTHGDHGSKGSPGYGHKVDHNSNSGHESHGRGVKFFHSSHSMSSKKSSSHSHGGPSKISKLLGFRDDSSSSEEEDESYHGHGAKGGSKGSSKETAKEHGGHVASFQPSYGSQTKQMQFSSQSKSVELKVPICCDNCERRVRSCLEKMHGVESVLCNQWNRKVIVYGNLKADDVLKRVRRVKKTSELWSNTKQQLVRLH